jgi:hypothetical protein
VIEPAGESRRLFQRRAQIMLGDSACRSLPNEHITIDAAIAKFLAQTFGKRLAAAERSSGNGNDGRDL